MKNKEEVAAKHSEGYFGKYNCRWCRPSPQFILFLLFIDHLILHEYMSKREPPEKPPGMDDSLWCHQEAMRRNPGKAPHLVEPLPPYWVSPFAWREPTEARPPKVFPEQKRFLPHVADWLKNALKSLPVLDTIDESHVLVAEQLLDLVKELPLEFQEQRQYLLEHEEKLEETGKDPKWLRKPGTQARFIAESMAGARWKLAPSTSREYIRQERQKAGTSKMLQLEPGVVSFADADSMRREGRWWEPREAEAKKTEA